MRENNEKSRIMVVDDTITNLTLLNELLTSHGYATAVFPKAEMALRALAANPPDLILLDISMPEMNGFEFCKKIKEQEEFRDIPVIFLSAMHNMEDKIKAFQLGGVDYITKPFQCEEVLIRVKNHVKLQRQQTQLEKSCRQLRQLEQSLEQQVAERTGELTTANARLRESQDELHKLNRELEQRVSERTLELQKANKALEESLDKLKKDEEAGRIVQVRLLPKNKISFNGYSFQYLFKPSLYMSGDFVNYFEIDHQHAGFYIVDVSGHGSASAFITLLVKSFVHSCRDNYLKNHDRTIFDPAAILAGLNTMLLEENPGKYVTMFFGVLKQDGGELVFSNGGHFPFPILCAGGGTEMIIEKSCPVGMFESSEYKNVAKPLPEEFFLLVLSDGILEIMDEKDTEPQLAILAEAAAACDGNLKKFTRILKADKQRNLLDDITILGVKREKRHG